MAAEALGVDVLGTDLRRRSHTIAGGTWDAQIEVVRLSLPGLRGFVWDAEVDFFVPDWGMKFGCLLGHYGFLDRFVASFNAYDNYFIVEERDSFIDRLPVDPNQEYERRDLGWKA